MAAPYEDLTDEQLSAEIARLTSKLTPTPTVAADATASPQMSDEELQSRMQLLEAQLGGDSVIDQPQSTPTEELGFFAGIKESATGTQRATEASRTLPGYEAMPELNEMSMGSFKASFGTIFGDQAEMANVMAKQFPNVSVRQDEKGNPILRSAIDGKEYVIAPGFDPKTDIIRGAAQTAMFLPAALASTEIVATAAVGAGIQGIYELIQKELGGEFGTAEVVTAGVVPAGLQAASAGFKATIMPVLQRQFSKLFSKTPAAPTLASAPVSEAEVLDLTTSAAFGNNAAKQALAEVVAPDAQTLAAAQRLGIADNLQPDHMTTSQVFREVSQLGKSQPASTARAAELVNLEAVGARALQLIDDLGGTQDLSTLSTSTRKTMNGLLEAVNKKVDDAWTTLRSAVGVTTQLPAKNTLAAINQRAIDLGGFEFLTPLERDLLKGLTPKREMAFVGGSSFPFGPATNPTYTLVDDLRRTVGRAVRGSGPYKDEAAGLANQLYKSLVLDIDAFVKGLGNDVATNSLVTTRVAGSLQKSLQDDLTSLFGKNVDESMTGLLENSVDQLAKGNADTFANLMNNLKNAPKPLRQSVAVSGLTRAFGRKAETGALNFNTYVNFYENLLKNRTSYRTLMANLPKGAPKQLSDLYRVSKGINLSLTRRITTGRALAGAVDPADTVMGRVLAVAKRAAIGLPVTIPLEMLFRMAGLPNIGITAALTAALVPRAAKTPIGKAVDDLISSPVFLKMVDAAGTAQQQEAVRALRANSAFKRFVSELTPLLPTSLNPETFALSLFKAAPQAAAQGAVIAPEEVVAPVAPTPAPTPASITPTAPPQVRVQTTPTRGFQMAQAQAPAAAPQGAQGPQARQMLQQLFPDDALLQAATLQA